MRLESLNSILKRLEIKLESVAGNYGRPVLPGKNYNFIHPWYYQEDLLAYSDLYHRYERARGQEKEELKQTLFDYQRWIESHDSKGGYKKDMEILELAKKQGLVA